MTNATQQYQALDSTRPGPHLWYPNQPLACRMEEARVRQHLPADKAYQMIRGPNLNLNPNMVSVITTASMDRVNEYHGSHCEIETTRARYDVKL
jgi:hypothetical protein